MFSLKAVGTFEGYEEAKSYPGKYYVYLRPCVPAPAGILQTVNVTREFGKPIPAMQQLGTLAVLCEESQLPQSGFGQKVALSAICWNICGAVWSKQLAAPVNTRKSHTLFTLDGEIKGTNAKPAPFALEFSGYIQGVRQSKEYANRLSVRITPEASVPREYLKTVPVDRPGKSQTSTKTQEVAGDAILIAEMSHIPAIPINTLVTGSAHYWPVCGPYFSNKDQDVQYRTIPDPVFALTGALVPDKGAAKSA